MGQQKAIKCGRGQKVKLIRKKTIKCLLFGSGTNVNELHLWVLQTFDRNMTKALWRTQRHDSSFISMRAGGRGI